MEIYSIKFKIVGHSLAKSSLTVGNAKVQCKREATVHVRQWPEWLRV